MRKINFVIVTICALYFNCSESYAQATYATPYNVTTIAGGNGGSSDGTGTAAQFSSYLGGIVSQSGNIYVSDSYNNTIRQINSSGTVSTLAGSAVSSGNTNGTGSAARFNTPSGMTIDSSGSLYVCDFVNSCIRKITADGIVTTFAGKLSVAGKADGAGSLALFNSPAKITQDTSGNFYVADSSGYIRKITPLGIVTTLTNYGANFNSNTSIAIDVSLNIYFSVPDSYVIKKVSPTGIVTTVAGILGTKGSKDGIGTSATFGQPTGIAIDSNGNLFILDTANSTIRKLSTSGVVSTIAGSAGNSGAVDGTGSTASFRQLISITCNSDILYFTDSTSIRKAVNPDAITLPPVISSQPSNQLVNLGGAASFTVSGTGSALTYQWYFNGAPISGATSSTYSISSAQTANAGNYYVIITNNSGSTTSSTTSLNLISNISAPQIVTQPVSQSIYVGSTSLLYIIASGTGPITYQWCKNGVPISGAINPTLIINTASSNDSGNYTVVVSNTAGTATSNSTLITVNATSSKSTSLIGLGMSFQLLPSNQLATAAYGNVTTYFSTYNGPSGSFLLDSSSNGVSGEIRPRQGSVGVYEGAFAQGNSSAYVNYCYYQVNFPTNSNGGIIDTNNYGVPDVLEYQNSGTFTATGTAFSTVFNLPFNISFNFARNAGSSTGTYTMTTSAGTATSTITGNFNLSNGTGTLSYTRGALNSMTITETGVSNTMSLVGTTSFTVVDQNTISYPSFQLKRSDGGIFVANAGTLTRSGKVYRGTLNVVDGLLQTYWPDYVNTVLIITDNNDTDGNGIPDFSDTLNAAPVFTTQPTTQGAISGTSITLSALATGYPSINYQWLFNDSPVAGATSSTYTISNVSSTTTGSYSVIATNSLGSITSSVASITVIASQAPKITTQPSSQYVNSGSSVTLAVTASGTPPLIYQWYKDSSAITGANTSIYTITSAAITDSGSYNVIISNSLGSITSNAVTLNTTSITAPPLITTQPAPQATYIGSSATLTAAITSTGNTTYQWYDNGIAILGANSPSYTVSSAKSTDTGIYTLVATNAAGSVTSSSAAIAVTTAPSNTPTSKLVNVSCLQQLPQNGILTTGFVIQGTQSMQVLIRVIGPALAAFGVPNLMGDPTLKLYDSSQNVIASNSAWGGSTAIAAAANTVAAFPIQDPKSKDSAVLVTLPAGAYTVQGASASGTSGTLIVEVYQIP